MIQRAFKLGRYLILGSSLISCSGASHKNSQSSQKLVQKKAIKLEMMSLWAKAEYSRLMGDEIQAQAFERNLEGLENELLDLHNAEETDIELANFSKN